MLKKLTAFSVNHPIIVLIVVAFITLAFGLQFPKVKTDTDPKHMLPATSPVRLYNDQGDVCRPLSNVQKPPFSHVHYDGGHDKRHLEHGAIDRSGTARPYHEFDDTRFSDGYQHR